MHLNPSFTVLLRRQITDWCEDARDSDLINIPVWHWDGDGIQVRLTALPDGRVKVSDDAATAMRLSFNGKEHERAQRPQWDRIVALNDATDEDGRLSFTVEPERLFGAVLQLVYVIAQLETLNL